MPVEIPFPAHAGEAREARAVGHAHEHGLGLVVEGVGGRQMGGAALVGMRRQEAVARLAGRRLETRRRLEAGPGQDPMRQAEPGGLACDEGGLVRALGTQAVIDRRHEHGHAPKGRPAGEEMHHRHGIRSPGDRGKDGRRP